MCVPNDSTLLAEARVACVETQKSDMCVVVECAQANRYETSPFFVELVLFVMAPVLPSPKHTVRYQTAANKFELI